MDYYYSSNPSMSGRGRFSSWGNSSYRGRPGESSFRSSRGGFSSSRGYSTSRGRGSYYSKYDSSSSKFTSDSGRFSGQEGSFRRVESSPYSRDNRSDVDPGRKRLRSESYSTSQEGVSVEDKMNTFIKALTKLKLLREPQKGKALKLKKTKGGGPTRRSHELEDYRGNGSRYSNSNSYTESRYSDFKKPRVSEYREEYRGRSSVASKFLPLRGRSIRGRVIKRGADSFLARKRAAFAGSRTASELIALRRAKLLRLRRLRERARLRMEEEKAVVEDKQKEDAEKAAAEDKGTEKEKLEESDDIGNEKSGEEKKKEDGEICETDADKDKKKSDEKFDFIKKSFMKLQCPQCNTKCITFKEYISHLDEPTHVKAMRDKSEQLKRTLAKMRIAQRNNQKKVDEADVSNMEMRTIFCPICKLNYSQEKVKHQASEAHKKLKSFLRPYCKICRLTFGSPMLYEKHICSLDHIRRKHSLDERLGKSKSLEYIENFMVVDSVGSGDETEEKEEKKAEETPKEKAEERPKEEPKNLGVEFIRKVEAFYCEVCRSYLPRLPDHDRVLKIHCRTKYHLRCYLRYGSDDLLMKIKEEGKENGEDGKREGTESHGDGESGLDDKLWADVSDLLNEVEPNAKSDDEEEEGGRFDRFKSNGKKENGEMDPEEEQGEIKEAKGTAEKVDVPTKEPA